LRIKTILLITFFFCFYSTFGQRNLSGRVIDEYLESAIEITIFDKDTIEIAKSDLNGYFKIELPKKTDELIFAGLGYEWKKIKIPEKCNGLEIIILLAGTYDFMSSKKIDRIRKKRFDKIIELHLQAFNKGIFKTEKPCFKQEFEPIKPELDKIAKHSKKLTKENKKNFKLLKVGDTITIPFSGSYKSDGTERTSLTVYSYIVEGKNFDCTIKGIVTKKQKNRKGYFLTYKVIDTNNCEYKSIIFNEKEVKIGEIFEQNMKYFKVITE
jgi:hypothetical protein